MEEENKRVKQFKNGKKIEHVKKQRVIEIMNEKVKESVRQINKKVRKRRREKVKGRVLN